MNSVCTVFLSAINLKNKVIGKVEGEVTALNAEVRKLETLVDDADAYQRRELVMISETAVPNVTQGEICANSATNLV